MSHSHHRLQNPVPSRRSPRRLDRLGSQAPGATADAMTGSDLNPLQEALDFEKTETWRLQGWDHLERWSADEEKIGGLGCGLVVAGRGWRGRSASGKFVIRREPCLPYLYHPDKVILRHLLSTSSKDRHTSCTATKPSFEAVHTGEQPDRGHLSNGSSVPWHTNCITRVDRHLHPPDLPQRRGRNPRPPNPGI